MNVSPVGFQNFINTIIAASKSKIESLAASGSSGISKLWSGGFAGISEQGMEELKTALKTYCDNIEAHINTFDEEGNISNAFKGTLNDAAREYIRAIKELLKAYVSLMRQNITEADDAYKKYTEQAAVSLESVRSDVETIRSEAANVKLD